MGRQGKGSRDYGAGGRAGGARGRGPGTMGPGGGHGEAGEGVPGKLLDKVSIPDIHNSIRLLSLEQRRQKQVLKIMYIQAQKGRSHAITNVNSRSQTKYVFKTVTKIGKKYEKSPYYLGTRLWNGLDQISQESESIYTLNKKLCHV